MKNAFLDTIVFIFIMIGSFLSPIAPMLLAVGVFILTDTWIAYKRVKKLGKENPKIQWTSKNLKSGLIPKMISYQLAVILFYIMDYTILNEFVIYFINFEYLMTKIVALTLIRIEILSIDESYKITYNRSLLQQIKNFLYIAKKYKNDLNQNFKSDKYN